MPNKVQSRLKALLIDFLKCYRIVFTEYTSDVSAGARINSGECGNVAQAVYHVLNKELGAENRVTIHANLNHAFLLLDEKGYDVQVLDGESVDFFNEKYMDLDAKPCSAKETFDAYSYCDALGCLLMEAFLTRHKTPVPKEIQHVLDNREDYDSIDWLSKYYLAFERVAKGEGL